MSEKHDVGPASPVYGQLHNYLRMHRRGRGLSQREIAYLLGSRAGSGVSRYERRRRVPQLKTALAYAIIVGSAVDALFPGLHREVSRTVIRRARVLLQKVSQMPQNRLRTRKLQTLERIISTSRS